MSITLMAAVWQCSFTPTDKLVALALADNANDNGVCWPSITNICKKTSLSERCVQGCIKRLEKSGFLKREIRYGRSTVYNVVPPHVVHPADNAPPQEMRPTPAPDAPPPPHVVHPEPSLEPSREPSKGLGRASADAEPAPPKPLKKIKTQSSRGTRLTKDWILPKDWGIWAEGSGMSRADIIKESEKFRDYWIAKSGSHATKMDWEATWRNWVRKHMEDFAK